MIRMIFGWTMMGGVMALSAHNHGVHLIREIMVPDGGLSLPKLMRGEVRVKDVEKQL